MIRGQHVKQYNLSPEDIFLIGYGYLASYVLDHVRKKVSDLC